MRYVLVILRGGEEVGEEPLHSSEHERFIDSLIGDNAVLLGGPFATSVDDAGAAYVLRCRDVEEARAIAARDPLVIHGVVRPQFVEWELVGVNPAAIEPSVLIRPEDV
jgi:hypothetical protein